MTETIRITPAAASAIFSAGNNAGDGWAPDEADVDDAIEALSAGGAVILPRRGSDQVAVVRCADGDIVAVGDANGAWAVTILVADDEAVERRRIGAGESGDPDMVALCDRALAGDAEARAEVEQHLLDEAVDAAS